MINVGLMQKLRVSRQTDLGFMLKDNEGNEVLLHYSQSLKEHKLNDPVEVFIYLDKKKRPTATQIKPVALVDEVGLFEVKEVKKDLGLFVSNNTPKDVLFSKDILPKSYKEWPEVGEFIFGKLTLKNDQFLVKHATKDEIVKLNKNVKYELLEQVNGTVVDIKERGVLVLSNDFMAIFIPTIEIRGDYHLGQKVVVSITKDMNGWYYGSLIKQKEFMIDEDKELILNYLKKYKIMSLTAKSSSEEIFDLLKISRKAFKRAYGGLYKDQIIEFDDKSTWLKKK